MSKASMLKSFNKPLALSLAIIMVLGAVPSGFSEPLRVQLEQGLEIDQIQCNNPNHVLVQRTNGNLACVSEKTAEKLGWKIIENSNISEISNTVLESENIGTTLVTLNAKNNVSMMGTYNICQEYPKNFAIEFPNSVRVNEPFDVVVYYTNVIYDEEFPDAIIDILDGPREYCNDTTIYASITNTLTVLSEHTLVDSAISPITDRGTTVNTIQYPFNNTEEQKQKISLQFNQLPDRKDYGIQFGSSGNYIDIQYYVVDGLIYLWNGDTVNNDIQVRGMVSNFQIDSEVRQELDYFTVYIPEPKVDPCEIRICDDDEDDSNDGMPMESLADYITKYVETDDLRAWLENENFGQNFIDEFLKLYPELVSQFLAFLTFDIPEAHAAVPNFVRIYGNAEYLGSPNNIPFEDVTVCAYDRDLRNPSNPDVPLMNGATPVCDITDSNGFYALDTPSDDPNDNGVIDLVLVFSMKNDNFNLLNYNYPSYNFPDVRGETNLEQSYYFAQVIDQSVEKRDITLSDTDEIIPAYQILEKLVESRNFINTEYRYTMPFSTIYYNNDLTDILCRGTIYIADSDRIRYDSLGTTSFCGIYIPIHQSDTVKHEYYHFYSDEIYTVKNPGQLADTSNWIPHTPAISLPPSQAWFEGIATGFVLMELDTHLYQPAGNPTPFNYETGTARNTSGAPMVFVEDNTGEGAITKMIRDLTDNTPSETGDNVYVSHTVVNNVFDDRLNTGETIVAETVDEYISDWREESGTPDISNVLFLNGLSSDVTDPQVQITSPVNRFTSGTTSITLSGTSSDNVGVESIEIRVNSVVITTLTSNLDNWSHAITLPRSSNTINVIAEDAAGNTGEHSIFVFYSSGGGGSGNNAPTISITSPANNSETDEGDGIAFRATARDDRDSRNSIRNSIVWSSDKDGVFGNNDSVNISGLSGNTHRITATATDSGGLSTSDSVNIVVNAADIPPVVIRQNWSVSLPSGEHRGVSSDSMNVNVNARDRLVFNYSVSSENNYDFGLIIIDNVEVFSVSGEESGEYTYQYLPSTESNISAISATDTINVKIEYTKDASVSKGTDTFTINRITHYVAPLLIDTVAPEINLLGDLTQTVIQNFEYKELGAICRDDIDGDISSSIVVDYSAVDIATLGLYEVTYDCQDAAGNDATQEVRNVRVALPQLNVTYGSTAKIVTNYWNLGSGSCYAEGTLMINNNPNTIDQFDMIVDCSSNLTIDLKPFGVDQRGGVYGAELFLDIYPQAPTHYTDKALANSKFVFNYEDVTPTPVECQDHIPTDGLRVYYNAHKEGWFQLKYTDGDCTITSNPLS